MAHVFPFPSHVCVCAQACAIEVEPENLCHLCHFLKTSRRVGAAGAGIQTQNPRKNLNMGTNQTDRADLSKHCTAELQGATSVAEMAEAEAWNPDLYAVNLARHIREDGVSPAAQVERLRALSQVGTGADKAASDELGRHSILLSALFEHLALASAKAANAGGLRSAEAAQRLATAAIRAQRAAAQCLGALKVLRDGSSIPTRSEIGRVSPDNGCE